MKKSKKQDLPKNTSGKSNQANLLNLPNEIIAEIRQKAKAVAAENGWIKIGQVAIDSGHLLICDPAKRDLENVQIMDVFTSKDWSTQYSESRAVVIPSGLGDGLYDVEARVAEVTGFGKRITEIRIGFVGLGTMYPILKAPNGEIAIGFIARHQDRYDD